jgi:glyoxylase-like metal-dependent hydrolase (beta-lactamase superfamily II)
MAYPFQAGSFDCWSVSDGANAAPNFHQAIFANADPAAVEQAMAEAGIDPALMVAQHTSTVIDTGDELVLVDTGAGPSGLPVTGMLIDNLRREGIQPEEITVVFLTHAHADHVGGNVTATGNPLYPNARYVMAQAEWDFWSDEAAVTEAIPNADARQGNLDSFQQNLLPLEGTIELIDDGAEVAPGLTAIATPGHTPGHMGLQVESDSATLWVLGDVALHPLQLQYPDFTGLFDTDPELTAETRRAIFGQIAGSGQATFKHFDPFPSLGEAVAEGDAWMWQPVEMAAEDSE